jgi:hypothetical protein
MKTIILEGRFHSRAECEGLTAPLYRFLFDDTCNARRILFYHHMPKDIILLKFKAIISGSYGVDFKRNHLRKYLYRMCDKIYEKNTYIFR